MAKNDVVLLDALLDQRAAAGTIADRSELFELFAFEQVLKSFDLAPDEIESGWTDGRNDGGIDGFFTFVNGHLIVDPTMFTWPRSAADIDVFVITCKHHDTFQQAPLDALAATFQEIFDLTKEPRQFAGHYCDQLLKARARFVVAYKQLSLLRPSLKFHIVYASRGDTSAIGENVAARGEQLKQLLERDFSAATARFEPMGAAEFVAAYREVKSFSLSLPFMEHLTAAQDGYVVLAKLTDYCQFVSDDRGQLRRYLFDSNVRDFLGENAVNADITNTLANPDAPNFWWLNNGVTVLATRATIVGKTIQLQDIQIVNGLQTTETLHRFLRSAPQDHLVNRSLLIKIIVSADEDVRDQVIRATNNQTSVEPSALHATDKIQRDIEEILERHDWYYERRKNYFRNAGHPPDRIITPLQIATAAVALVLKSPERAGSLRQKHLRRPSSYDAVFSDTLPIQVWPRLADCLHLADETLLRYRDVHRTARPRYLAKWSGLLAYLSIIAHFKTHFYSTTDLAGLPLAEELEDLMLECAELMSQAIGAGGFQSVSFAVVKRACELVAAQYSVAGLWEQARRGLPSPLPGELASKRFRTLSRQAPHRPQPNTARRPRPGARPSQVEQGLVDAVDNLLPDQPWKPGVHTSIARALGVAGREVSKAIAQLIHDGRRHDQRDGVVYDRDGMVIAVDESRIRPVGS